MSSTRMLKRNVGFRIAGCRFETCGMSVSDLWDIGLRIVGCWFQNCGMSVSELWDVGFTIVGFV
jgi:hypothetical protein